MADKELVIQNLKIVMCETFTLYFKTHFYHWNVEGPNFKQLHDFFGNIYEELFNDIDLIAEQIRAIGAYAPGSFDRVVEMSKINTTNIVNSPGMINTLKVDMEILIDSIKNAIKIIGNDIDYVNVSNFLQDRLDARSKNLWMINSFLKGQKNDY